MPRTPHVSVVTGAAGGLGTAIVETLLRRGDRVIASDVSEAAVAALGERVTASLGDEPARERLLTIAHDVADEAGWEELRHRADTTFGAPDVLVNNAGISPKHDGAKLDGVDIPLDEWNAVLAVNLTGAFLGIRALAPAMQRGGYGRIVNMASLAARNGGRIGGVHYAATKTGLLGLTRSFARELAAFGITVNAVAPGRIDAGMVAMTSTRFNDDYRASIPVGRLGTAADVARAVAFLTDAESGFITGTTTDVNGGGHMQ